MSVLINLVGKAVLVSTDGISTFVYARQVLLEKPVHLNKMSARPTHALTESVKTTPMGSTVTVKKDSQEHFARPIYTNVSQSLAITTEFALME